MAYLKNPNIIEENISDTELMLFNQSTEELHVLNETSAQIYILICLGNSLVEALYQYVYEHIGEVCEDKPMTVDELANDAKETINSLLDRNIIIGDITDE